MSRGSFVLLPFISPLWVSRILQAMIFSILHMLRYFWTIVDKSKLEKSKSSEFTSTPSPIDLRKLAAPSDLALLPTIEYAYDPLPEQPRCRDYHPLILPDEATAINKHTSLNSILIDPISAGLPYRSTINHVRASKHWKANLDETLILLDLLASDNSASDIEVKHGITLSKLAQSQLRPGREHQMVLATHYMFPSASERRIRLIAALTVLYFVFDGICPTVSEISLTFFLTSIHRQSRRDPKQQSPPSPLSIANNNTHLTAISSSTSSAKISSAA